MVEGLRLQREYLSDAVREALAQLLHAAGSVTREDEQEASRRAVAEGKIQGCEDLDHPFQVSQAVAFVECERPFACQLRCRESGAAGEADVPGRTPLRRLLVRHAWGAELGQRLLHVLDGVADRA